MTHLKPLFMWAGGKTKMLKHHVPYLPLTIESYSEPFFGGGAMFLHIINQYNPKEVVINDIYYGIYNIYNSIKEDVDSFIKVMDKLEQMYLSQENRKEFYYSIRHKHAWEYQAWDCVEEAAHHYFLLRTGFNGILQINKNTNGRYGTPFGLGNQTKSIYCKDLVKAWSDLLKCVTILNSSYEDVPLMDFTYCDPPYLYSFTQYGQVWDKERTLELIGYARDGNHAMVCNRSEQGDSFFQDNQGDFNLLEIPVTYTAGRRKKTPEGYESKKATEVLLWK